MPIKQVWHGEFFWDQMESLGEPGENWPSGSLDAGYGSCAASNFRGDVKLDEHMPSDNHGLNEYKVSLIALVNHTSRK